MTRQKSIALSCTGEWERELIRTSRPVHCPPLRHCRWSWFSSHSLKHSKKRTRTVEKLSLQHCWRGKGKEGAKAAPGASYLAIPRWAGEAGTAILPCTAPPSALFSCLSFMPSMHHSSPVHFKEDPCTAWEWKRQHERGGMGHDCHTRLGKESKEAAMGALLGKSRDCPY